MIVGRAIVTARPFHMETEVTEAEAREIVERYEALAQAIVGSSDQKIEPGGFSLDFPIEVERGKASVTENHPCADAWRLHTVSMKLD